MTKLNQLLKILLNWKILIPTITLLLLGLILFVLPNIYLKPLVLDSYNPTNLPGIDYQMTNIGSWDKPVIATLIPNGQDNYQIIYSEYNRIGLFLFQDTKTFRGNPLSYLDYSSVIGSINNKPISQAKDILSKYDLTKYNPDSNNINTVNKTALPPDEELLKNKKYIANLPENQAFDLLDLDPNSANRGLEDYKDKLKVGDIHTNYFPFFKFSEMGGGIGISYGTFPNQDRMGELQFVITNNPRVKFIALQEKCGDIEFDKYCREIDLKTLKAVNIVLKDRTIIPVPVNDQGYFDFEAVKGKWE